jgi:hypothetical protein
MIAKHPGHFFMTTETQNSASAWPTGDGGNLILFARVHLKAFSTLHPLKDGSHNVA